MARWNPLAWLTSSQARKEEERLVIPGLSPHDSKSGKSQAKAIYILDSGHDTGKDQAVSSLSIDEEAVTQSSSFVYEHQDDFEEGRAERQLSFEDAVEHQQDRSFQANDKAKDTAGRFQMPVNQQYWTTQARDKVGNFQKKDALESREERTIPARDRAGNQQRKGALDRQQDQNTPARDKAGRPQNKSGSKPKGHDLGKSTQEVIRGGDKGQHSNRKIPVVLLSAPPPEADMDIYDDRLSREKNLPELQPKSRKARGGSTKLKSRSQNEGPVTKEKDIDGTNTQKQAAKNVSTGKVDEEPETVSVKKHTSKRKRRRALAKTNSVESDGETIEFANASHLADTSPQRPKAQQLVQELKSSALDHLENDEDASSAAYLKQHIRKKHGLSTAGPASRTPTPDGPAKKKILEKDVRWLSKHKQDTPLSRRRSVQRTLEDSAAGVITHDSPDPERPSKKALGKRKATDEPTLDGSKKKSRKQRKLEGGNGDIRTFVTSINAAANGNQSGSTRSRSGTTHDSLAESHELSSVGTPDSSPPHADKLSRKNGSNLQWNAINNSRPQVDEDVNYVPESRIEFEEEQSPVAAFEIAAGSSLKTPKRTVPVSKPNTQNESGAARMSNNEPRSVIESSSKKRKRRLPVSIPEHSPITNPRKPAKRSRSGNEKPKSSEAPASEGETRPISNRRRKADPELDALSKAIEFYRDLNHMTQFQINELVQKPADREGKDLWKHVWSNVLLESNQLKARKKCRRKFHNWEALGTWTTEQMDDLKVAHQTYSASWAKIGKALNRDPEDCRDRWRNYLVCGDKQRKDAWDIGEEKKLKEAFAQCLEAVREMHEQDDRYKESGKTDFELVDFDVISQHMGRTRSRLQCLQKWKALTKREAVVSDDEVVTAPSKFTWRTADAAQISSGMAATEKLHLLYAIRDSNVGSESKILWYLFKEYMSKQGHEVDLQQQTYAWKLSFRHLRRQLPGNEDLGLQDTVQRLIEIYESSVPFEPPAFDEFKLSSWEVTAAEARLAKSRRAKARRANNVTPSRQRAPRVSRSVVPENQRHSRHTGKTDTSQSQEGAQGPEGTSDNLVEDPRSASKRRRSSRPISSSSHNRKSLSAEYAVDSDSEDDLFVDEGEQDIYRAPLSSSDDEVSESEDQGLDDEVFDLRGENLDPNQVEVGEDMRTDDHSSHVSEVEMDEETMLGDDQPQNWRHESPEVGHFASERAGDNQMLAPDMKNSIEEVPMDDTPTQALKENTISDDERIDEEHDQRTSSLTIDPEHQKSTSGDRSSISSLEEESDSDAGKAEQHDTHRLPSPDIGQEPHVEDRSSDSSPPDEYIHGNDEAEEDDRVTDEDIEEFQGFDSDSDTDMDEEHELPNINGQQYESADESDKDNESEILHGNVQQEEIIRSTRLQSSWVENHDTSSAESSPSVSPSLDGERNGNEQGTNFGRPEAEVDGDSLPMTAIPAVPLSNSPRRSATHSRSPVLWCGGQATVTPADNSMPTTPQRRDTAFEFASDSDEDSDMDDIEAAPDPIPSALSQISKEVLSEDTTSVPSDSDESEDEEHKIDYDDISRLPPLPEDDESDYEVSDPRSKKKGKGAQQKIAGGWKKKSTKKAKAREPSVEL